MLSDQLVKNSLFSLDSFQSKNFNVEVSENQPDPFDHDTKSLEYSNVQENEQEFLTGILSRAWGLQPPKSLRLCKRGNAYSSIYLITYAKKSFILRRSKLLNDKKQLILEKCKNFAYQKGLPVPQIVKTINDNLFFEWSEFIYTLTPYIDGDVFDGSKEKLEEAGLLLGKFHKIFRSYTKTNIIRHEIGEVYHRDQITWNLLKNKIKQGRYSFDSWVLNWIPWVEENTYSNKELEIKQIYQVGHFDWNPHNLIFSKNKRHVLGILDFDLLRYSQRARDVSLGMHKFSRIFGIKTHKKMDPEGTISNRASIFLQAYNSVNPLFNFELKAIPYLIRDESRRKIEYILSKHYLHNDPSSDYDLQKHLTLIAESNIMEESIFL